MKDSDIAIAILAKNEEEFIVDCINHIIDLNNHHFWIFDDSDPENSNQVMKILQNKKYDNRVFVEVIPKNNDFSKKRNFIHKYLKNKGFKAVLHIDVDEVFDPWFLMNIGKFLDQFSDKLAFKFPRINFPHGFQYPDWQVRLIRLQDNIKWERKIHEIPVILKENGESKVSLHDYIETLPMKNLPILHLQRDDKKKRDWW